MATTHRPSTSICFLLNRFFPHAIPRNTTDTDIGTLSSKIYPDISYTSEEHAEIKEWVSTSERLGKAASDPAGLATFRSSDRFIGLDQHLQDRSTILGTKPSVADVALYAGLAPALENWSAEERTGKAGFVNTLRYLDAVQNSPIFGLKIPEEEKVILDIQDTPSAPSAPPATTPNPATHKPLVVGLTKDKTSDPLSQKPTLTENAQEKVEDPKAAVMGDKTEKKQAKKEKKPKQAAAPAVAAPLSPAQIDLRVGHILRAVAHPNADSLYVSTIACGDAPGTDNTSEDGQTGQTVRTVCSGLNGLIPLAEMQDRKVVVVANLKPVTMRGIKSAAMVLAASPRVAEGEDDHAKDRTVELVSPPSESAAGERVYFEGYRGEPEKVLNPKKKVWETLAPGFGTTEDLEACFDPERVEAMKGEGEASTEAKKSVGKLFTKDGRCTVKTLAGAVVR